MADTGDIYRITTEKVNLRAGPSNEASIRTALEEGDELIELQSEGPWLGVRVLSTGEEGWVYGELVEQVAQSLLDEAMPTGPFVELSGDFDRLINSVNNQLGYNMVDQVQKRENNTLQITPTREWLLYGGREAHLMAAVAFYQMWKNHQDRQPVNLVLVDDQNENYISINDAEAGPMLSIQEPRQE